MKCQYLFKCKHYLVLYDVLCAPCQIERRVAFIHAYNSGSVVQELEPNSKSTREIQALYRYIVKEMGV